MDRRTTCHGYRECVTTPDRPRQGRIRNKDQILIRRTTVSGRLKGNSIHLNLVAFNSRGIDLAPTRTVGLQAAYRGILTVIEEEAMAAVDEVALAVEVFSCLSCL